MLEALSAGREAGAEPGKVSSPSQGTDILHQRPYSFSHSPRFTSNFKPAKKNKLWILHYRLFLSTAGGV